MSCCFRARNARSASSRLSSTSSTSISRVSAVTPMIKVLSGSPWVASVACATQFPAHAESRASPPHRRRLRSRPDPHDRLLQQGQHEPGRGLRPPDRGTAEDFDRLIAALQTFLDDYFVPVWGTPAKLVKVTTFRKGAWAMAFLDDADVANALGYHDLTPDGLPLSKVFVKSTRAVGQKVSVTACHELA